MAVYVKVFVIGAMMREPMNQTGIAAAVAGAGPQPTFEEQDRASQITARLIRNGQAPRAMLVEFPARFFNWLIRATTRRRGTHDLFDTHFRRAPVISRYAATHVTFGDNAGRA